MKLRNLATSLFLVFLAVSFAGCNAQGKKGDFNGKYRIDKYVPADSSAAILSKISQASDWVISLEKDNNFELTGKGKHIVGYWSIEKMYDKESKILLQGGGSTIYGRFDSSVIYFDKPYRMFDELFAQANFKKIEE